MSDIEALEGRVGRLEEKLLGAAGATTETSKRRLIDDVITINNQLHSSLGNKDKFEQVFRQIRQIQQLSDPTYADSLALSPDSKLQVIEACMPMLEKRIHQMELLQSGQEVLDSEHIRNAPSLRPKMEQIALAQTTTLSAVAEHTEEVSDLVKEYNRLVMDLSKQFTYWDHILTKAEAAKK